MFENKDNSGSMLINKKTTNKASDTMILESRCRTCCASLDKTPKEILRVNHAFNLHSYIHTIRGKNAD